MVHRVTLTQGSTCGKIPHDCSELTSHKKPNLPSLLLLEQGCSPHWWICAFRKLLCFLKTNKTLLGLSKGCLKEPQENNWLWIRNDEVVYGMVKYRGKCRRTPLCNLSASLNPVTDCSPPVSSHLSNRKLTDAITKEIVFASQSKIDTIKTRQQCLLLLLHEDKSSLSPSEMER